MRDKYTVLVEEDGVVKLKDVPLRSRPSNFIAFAPPNMREGMDDLLIKDGLMYNCDQKKVAERLEQAQWNDSSIVDRIKGKIFG
jgi:acyl-CoA hydrolase